jgi:hypothetical protein
MAFVMTSMVVVLFGVLYGVHLSALFQVPVAIRCTKPVEEQQEEEKRQTSWQYSGRPEESVQAAFVADERDERAAYGKGKQANSD